MSKRGRPRVPAHLRAIVKMQVRVSADLADRLYVLALRRRTTVSALTREYYQSITDFSTDEKSKTRTREALSVN